MKLFMLFLGTSGPKKHSKLYEKDRKAVAFSMCQSPDAANGVLHSKSVFV